MISLLLVASIINFNALPPRMTPPPQYRGEAVTIVGFVDTQEEMNTLCGNTDPRFDIIGCKGPSKIKVKGKALPMVLVSNPCNYPDDLYARSVCHEMGHANGWPANHPDPQ